MNKTAIFIAFSSIFFFFFNKNAAFAQNTAVAPPTSTGETTGKTAEKPTEKPTERSVEKPTAKAAVLEPIAWNTLAHDFGNIPQGREVSFDFKFTNNTQDSIEIDNIRTTCGCTAASWQEDAIQPTQTTTIPVLFDAHELGYFEKTIKVYLKHIRKPFILTIIGEVQ